MSDYMEFLKERQITRLCHFVRTNKLLHILNSEKGIEASAFIEEEIFQANDKQRLDGKTDYVNCSVQYPNTFYLDRIKDKDPVFTDWAIIFIDPKIIEQENTLFCQINAATNKGNYIKKGFEEFKRLFSYQLQIGHNIKRTPTMLSNAATDLQAEVLLYKNIPRKYITGIALKTEKIAREKKAAWSVINVTEIDIYISPDLFSTGSILSSKIRSGNCPSEYKYVEE